MIELEEEYIFGREKIQEKIALWNREDRIRSESQMKIVKSSILGKLIQA
jgi:hypothetical protein